jgi:hypothetical protein
MSNQFTSPAFVGLEECRITIFGTGREAPSKRLFAEWKARGYFPFIKVGKRVFADPAEVSRALNRRFKINSVDGK